LVTGFVKACPAAVGTFFSGTRSTGEAISKVICLHSPQKHIFFIPLPQAAEY
jgi:hypothetical protein